MWCWSRSEVDLHTQGPPRHPCVVSTGIRPSPVNPRPTLPEDHCPLPVNPQLALPKRPSTNRSTGAQAQARWRFAHLCASSATQASRTSRTGVILTLHVGLKSHIISFFLRRILSFKQWPTSLVIIQAWAFPNYFRGPGPPMDQLPWR